MADQRGNNAHTMPRVSLLKYLWGIWCCSLLINKRAVVVCRLWFTLCSHVPHLWHRPVNSITMVARSHKYWTTRTVTQSCHKQVDNAGWMSPWLAIIWWRLSPSSTSPGIVQTTVEGPADNWCHKSVVRRLAIGYGGQFHISGRPHNPTSRFWSSPASVPLSCRCWIVFSEARATVMCATRNGVGYGSLVQRVICPKGHLSEM